MKTKLSEKASKEWSKLVGLPLTVEEIAGALYAFGDELAVLRLGNKMGVAGRVGFSKPRSSWFYAQEIAFPTPEG